MTSCCIVGAVMRLLRCGTPLVADERIVEIIINNQKLLSETFIQQLRDELHHASLHLLAHRVQLLLGHTQAHTDTYIHKTIMNLHYDIFFDENVIPEVSAI